MQLPFASRIPDRQGGAKGLTNVPSLVDCGEYVSEDIFLGCAVAMDLSTCAPVHQPVNYSEWNERNILMSINWHVKNRNSVVSCIAFSAINLAHDCNILCIRPLQLIPLHYLLIYECSISRVI